MLRLILTILCTAASYLLLREDAIHLINNTQCMKIKADISCHVNAGLFELGGL